MRDQIDLLSKLSGLATDEDYDNVVGILETLEAIVKVVDPSGNDPSFDLSRCPKCDSSNVIFEGTNVEIKPASMFPGQVPVGGNRRKSFAPVPLERHDVLFRHNLYRQCHGQ